MKLFLVVCCLSVHPVHYVVYVWFTVTPCVC